MGGAHRDKNLILSNVGESILKNLDLFKEMSGEEILDQRKNKFLKIGRSKGFISNPESLSELENKKSNFDQFFYKNKRILFFSFAFIFIALSLLIIL